MKAIQTNVGKIEVQDLLSAIAQEKIFDIEQFLKQVKNILDQKKTPDFIKKEKELLDKIENDKPSKETWLQYNLLADKLDKKTLTEKEREEFRTLVKSIRQWEMQQISMMLELAKLWNTSLDEVKKYLDLTPQPTSHA